jgi:hypothetical protein
MGIIGFPTAIVDNRTPVDSVMIEFRLQFGADMGTKRTNRLRIPRPCAKVACLLRIF